MQKATWSPGASPRARKTLDTRLAASSSWRYEMASPVDPMMTAGLSGVVAACSPGYMLVTLATRCPADPHARAGSVAGVQDVDAYARFLALFSRPDASLPLDEVALCIAAHADPDVDIAANLARLDDLAEKCPAPTLDALVTHLFRTEGFAGNRADYYDPRNSFLHEVLDRRLGIPITLSIVVLEVGRRLGVPLSGVGLPGHFLVRDKVDDRVFIDPFHGGRLLDESACRRLHATLAGP